MGVAGEPLWGLRHSVHERLARLIEDAREARRAVERVSHQPLVVLIHLPTWLKVEGQNGVGMKRFMAGEKVGVQGYSLFGKPCLILEIDGSHPRNKEKISFVVSREEPSG